MFAVLQGTVQCHWVVGYMIYLCVVACSRMGSYKYEKLTVHSEQACQPCVWREKQGHEVWPGFMHLSLQASKPACTSLQLQLHAGTGHVDKQAYLIAAMLLQQLTQQLIMHGQCAGHDRLIPASLASSVLTVRV